jgi:hypothetical protein
MWIAIRENATYTATVRKDGKFTGNYCHELLSAVFEWSWLAQLRIDLTAILESMA